VRVAGLFAAGRGRVGGDAARASVIALRVIDDAASAFGVVRYRARLESHAARHAFQIDAAASAACTTSFTWVEICAPCTP
jgi:hypothetical protein